MLVVVMVVFDKNYLQSYLAGATYSFVYGVYVVFVKF